MILIVAHGTAHESNSIVPGKRPLSSMTPTIVSKDDKPFLVTGSPGGPTKSTDLRCSLYRIGILESFHLSD